MSSRLAPSATVKVWDCESLSMKVIVRLEHQSVGVSVGEDWRGLLFARLRCVEMAVAGCGGGTELAAGLEDWGECGFRCNQT
jgi:hypothetical protein